MKQTQKKDALRNILKQRVSYFSIVVIAAMAVTAYLGISFSSAALKNDANEFYSETNFRDMEVLSTLLMSEDDFKVLKATPGVAAVEGVCQTSGQVGFGDQHEAIYVVSLTEKINTPRILSGRLPVSPEECVLEEAVADALGMKEGDVLTVENEEGQIPQFLARQTFTVVGIVLHPDHLGNPGQVPGNRYILVPKEAFDWETYPECFLKAEILIEKDPSLNRFSKAYYREISETEALLRGMGDSRADLRTKEVVEENQQKIDEGASALADVARELSGARSELDEGQEKVESGEKELAEAEKEIGENEQRLQEAQKLLESALPKLQDAKTQLEEGYEQLTDGQSQLDAKKEELAAAWEKLEEGKAKLDAAKEQLISGFDQIGDAEQMIRDRAYDAIRSVLGEYADQIAWAAKISEINVDDPDVSATFFQITENVGIDLDLTIADRLSTIIGSIGLSDEKMMEAYEKTTGKALEVREGETVADALTREAYALYSDLDEKYEIFASYARTWDQGHDEYIAGLQEYLTGLSQYQDGLALWEENRDKLQALWDEYYGKYAEYEQGLKEYEDGLAQYEEGIEQLGAGKEAYQKGLQELEDAKNALVEGEKKYQEGVAEYEKGQQELDEAQEKLDNMEAGRWVFFGMHGNASYMHLLYSADNTQTLSLTFSMMFIVIAALVIYATVGRIVQEQRKLVGTTKALGFFTREILAKYMIFGVSSTLLGSLLGILLAYFMVETIVLRAYGLAYVLGTIHPLVKPLTTFLVVIAAALLAAAAVYMACRRLMKATAISLMQEQMPKGKKAGKKDLSSNTGKGLYNRLILRNIRSDIPRVAVTIVSVAGCCALLVIGFTLRGAVADAINRQYGDIVRFDDKLVFNPEQAKQDGAEFAKILQEEGADYVLVYDETRPFRAGEEMEMTELIAGDLQTLDGYYAFTDWKSRKPLQLPSSGAILKGRVAESNEAEVGDLVVVYNDLMKPFPIRIEALYNNYIGRELFVSEETYAETFGEKPVYNTFLVRRQGADPEKLMTRLSAVSGFMSFESAAAEKQKFEDYTKVLTLIAVLLTVVAGLMAYFILLNICNMYISQKKRELIIMRINGFTVREVKNYVARETIYTTAAGIILGLGVGTGVGYQIIRFVELPHVQFVRSPYFIGWALAVVITLIFVWLINYLSLRQVSTLKMTDL